MSIIRVGLSETQKFAVGYDAIFRGRRATASKALPAAKKKIVAKKKKPIRKKR